MKSLSGNRVLVTGGAGLIGSTIIDLLAVHDVAEVVVLDNFSRGTHANLADAVDKVNLTVIEGDIRDRATVEAAMKGIDVVFHEAAIRITQCAEEPRLAVDVLVNGAYNVFEAAVHERVSRVVTASSASIYGQAEVLPTPETHHPYANDTLYGAAKVFNEGLLRSFARTTGLDYVALRYFNVYGPRMDVYGVYTEVLVRWMERLDGGLPPVIHGNGDQTMDFIHVHDVARANVLAAMIPTGDQAYNIATGKSTSLLELATMLTQVMGRDFEPEFVPERNHVTVQHRRADVSAAALDLGFAATIDLEEGLSDLVAWWRQTLDRTQP